MFKKAILFPILLMSAMPAWAETYNFNFTFTNPGAVMLNDGLGSGTRTFSGQFSYDDVLDQLTFISGTYGNGNGSMTLSSADVSEILGTFTPGETPRLSLLLFDWSSTLGGAEYADDVYSYSNGRLTWDSGLGSGQFERVTSPTATYIESASVPEVRGPSLVGVAFILISLLCGVALKAPLSLGKSGFGRLRPQPLGAVGG